MQLRLTPIAAALTVAFLALPAAAQTTSTSADTEKKEQALPTVTVNASADASADGLPAPYSGGQVARGGRVGFMGNKDYLDTPFNTTSYTQELIKDQQARSVADVLQNDPSVRISRGFGNFQELYVIRGFALNSDDLAYNGLYGLLPRQYVATELLERVEVLRGASAFLNGMTPGSTGIGGTINLLPKRATSEPISQATVGWETGGQGYYAADIGRRFGPDERFGIRVNAARREGGTAVDNENRDLGLMSVGLDYRGNNFRLSADVGYQEQKLNQARPSFTVGTLIPAVPDNSTNTAQPWSYSNERDFFGTARAEVDLSQDVTAWLAYGSRMGIENNSLSPTTVLAADGTASSYRADNTRVDFIRTGEAGIRGKFSIAGIKHELSATASIFTLDKKNSFAWSTVGALRTNIYNPITLVQPATVTAITSGGDMANPRTTEYEELTSFAVADTMSFMDDKLQVTLGARHQNVKDVTYAYYTSRQNAYYNESAVTPMAGLLYKLSKSLSVYGNYVEGLQKGPSAPATASNAGQIFAPYKSKQKEVGMKYDGGKIGGSLALFSINQPNSVTVNNVFSLDGEQRNRGAELSVFGTPARGIKLLGGITLLEAKQITGGANNGKYAIGVPKTQANLGAEWDVPGVQGLSLNARAVYTAPQYANATNTLEVSSWTRYDAGVRYMTSIGSQLVTIRGRVDNLFNKNYWASATSSYLVMGNPRTFTISAAVDF
ncbi:TonB-dependent siderophore receptor [Herbaspirillum lusitanum]|uniref:TonB-dependent siderophore receptor n=1 Tax=Herbaspirillum lusitanum TaxID=213312 RepID=A0ABW9AF25_9BURK